MIQIKELSLRFEQHVLFDRMDSCVDKGEKVVITGASGSGKTSLLHCLTGFTIPQSGTILIDGIALNTDTIDRIRRTIAYLPQEVSLDVKCGKELLLYPFQFRANRTNFPTQSEIESTLAALLLPKECLDQPLIELSGGQKQRLLFASVWLLDRPLLLLDEPTSALDDASVEALIALICTRPHVTIVSISHDRRWIDAMDRTLHLSNNDSNLKPLK